MKTLVKSSIKLLIRTKIIWLFIVLMPILSTVVLKSNTEYTAYMDEVNRLIELEDADKKVAYNGEKGDYVVKVYDASHSEMSDYLLDRLVNSGMFVLCRADISKENISEEFLNNHIDFDGHEDRMGSALYIPADFDEKVINGEYAKALTLYELSEDARTEAFVNELNLQLSRMDTAKGYIVESIFEADSEAEEIVQILKNADEASPEKEVVSVSGNNARHLTAEQTNQRAQMGYAFAFLTLGFVFAGFFVANGAIKEQKNGVFTRVTLSKTNTLTYFVSKFVTTFVVCVVMTGVVGVCSLMLNMEDMGMNRGTFLLMIFMMGLIFSSLSMFIGIMFNDVFSASIASFTLWCTSSLFSGLYFPLDTASDGIKILSSFMPQKWFLDGAEMIFVGDNKAFSMVICITVAYIAIIVSLGSVGLKVRRSKEWGVS